jgi:hypothetical protein
MIGINDCAIPANIFLNNPDCNQEKTFRYIPYRFSTTFCLKTPQTTRINTDFVNFWNKPIMKITFCLAVGLVTGIMLPLRSNASENQVPQTPTVAPINSLQTSPQSSPTGFNERLSDTSKTSETMSGSGKSTETLSDTSKPSVSKPSVIESESSKPSNTVSDSPDASINAGSTQKSKPESVTSDKTEEKTETPMTTDSASKSDASESKTTTTEKTTKPTGSSTMTEQIDSKTDVPRVIKNGQMTETVGETSDMIDKSKNKTDDASASPQKTPEKSSESKVKTGAW